MPERHEICPASEIPPGERKLVEAGGLPVGIFNLEGDYYALANTCPHQLAELCRGQIGGVRTSSRPGEYNLEREGEIIRCPRHRWAFDIKTGESVFNPHVRTRSFDVEIEDPEEAEEIEVYGTSLEGDEPPIDTYDVEVEEGIVVLYV